MNSTSQIISSQPDYRRLELLSCLSRSPSGPARPPGRLTLLAALDHSLPETLVTETIARTLHEETGDTVCHLQFIAGAQTAGQPLAEPVRSEADFVRRLNHTFTGVDQMTLLVRGESKERRHLDSLLDLAAHLYRHVLVQIEPEAPEAVWSGCCLRATQTFLLLRQSTEHLYRLSLLRQEWPGHFTGRPNLKTVLCLAAGEQAHGFHHAINELDVSLEHLVHDCPGESDMLPPSRIFDRDVRRIAREIGHCRTGLALSSGGAKGLAHIGVLQVLEENNIEIDVVAGASMGAYVASIWANGADGAELERLAREVEHKWGLWQLIDPVFPPRQGFMRGIGVKRRLMRSIGEAHFSDLLRPLRVIATQQNTFERVVFDRGEVARAVHASCAIPGVCMPVTIDGEEYIDGGVTDPLPVDVLREMGVERVIAVNTLPTPAHLRCVLEMEQERAARKARRHPVLHWLNKHVNYLARGNILDNVLTCVHGAQMRVAEATGRAADVVLRPLATDSHWHDFTHPGKYIALGRAVALEHLSEIKTLVKRRTYEPAHLENPMEVAA